MESKKSCKGDTKVHIVDFVCFILGVQRWYPWFAKVHRSLPSLRSIVIGYHVHGSVLANYSSPWRISPVKPVVPVIGFSMRESDVPHRYAACSVSCPTLLNCDDDFSVFVRKKPDASAFGLMKECYDSWNSIRLRESEACVRQMIETAMLYHSQPETA